MLKEINKFYLIASACFILGLICLMLNVVNEMVFNLLFSIFIALGVAIICVKKIIDYNEFKKELSLTKESMAIDMTLSSTGSYEMKSGLTKKQQNEIKAMKRSKIMVIVFLIALFLLMVFLGYKLLEGNL